MKDRPPLAALALSLALLLSLAAPSPARGESPCVAPAPDAPPALPPAACDGRPIAALRLATGGTVKPRAVRRHLRLGVGDRFDAAVWAGDLQQLRNLGLFRRLDTRLEAVDADGGLRLLLTVEANWALLPILGYQRGALDVLLIGGFEANLFDELIELGAFYLRRDRFDLGRVWLALPNVVHPGTQLRLEAVLAASTLALYPSAAGDVPAALAAHHDADRLPWTLPAAGFELQRRGALVDFGVDLLPGRLNLALRYLLLWQRVYALDNLQLVLDRQARDLDPPGLRRRALGSDRLSLPALNLRLGQIDLVDNYLFRGRDLRAVYVPSLAALGSQRPFHWTYLSARSFHPLVGPLELALQAGYAHSSSDDPLDQFTLGGDNLDPFVHDQAFPGLLNVRGLPSSTLLHGANILFANLEGRLTLTDHLPLGPLGPVAVQLAAFADLGQAWDGSPWRAQALDPRAVSAGGGLLFSLRDMRWAYLNLYAARCFAPLPGTALDIVLTRPIF